MKKIILSLFLLSLPALANELRCADEKAAADRMQFGKASAYLEGAGEGNTLRWRLFLPDAGKWKRAATGYSKDFEQTKKYLVWEGYTDDFRFYRFEVHQTAWPFTFLRPADIHFKDRRLELHCYYYGGEPANRGLCELYGYPAEAVHGETPVFRIKPRADKQKLVDSLKTQSVFGEIREDAEGLIATLRAGTTPIKARHEILSRWCREKTIASIYPVLKD